MAIDALLQHYEIGYERIEDGKVVMSYEPTMDQSHYWRELTAALKDLRGPAGRTLNPYGPTTLIDAVDGWTKLVVVPLAGAKGRHAVLRHHSTQGASWRVCINTTEHHPSIWLSDRVRPRFIAQLAPFPSVTSGVKTLRSFSVTCVAADRLNTWLLAEKTGRPPMATFSRLRLVLGSDEKSRTHLTDLFFANGGRRLDGPATLELDAEDYLIVGTDVGLFEVIVDEELFGLIRGDRRNQSNGLMTTISPSAARVARDAFSRSSQDPYDVQAPAVWALGGPELCIAKGLRRPS